MSELTDLPIHAARALLEAGSLSSEELTRAYLTRIEALDPRVNAFLTPTPELALEQARRADERRRSGDAGPLLGIPMALKDVRHAYAASTTAAGAHGVLRGRPSAKFPTTVKLYNASNFFDPRAVPESDYDAIAEQLSGLDRVIVESHPSLVGPRVDARGGEHLLGGHVHRRPEQRGAIEDRRRLCVGSEELGDAEVEHLHQR